ncbi:Tetratricopeptide repeat-containing protein [Streptomyces aidingensis]|uniref:Tetratricopeptide repeat-containing protein n=1 Tax=Streptomyces aidingensis TaxID=910347 RepID=A0A1I1K218_9ACTN|nr:Tetratricopeptide repeat-containing protein [Streptomyces aidingensis]
MVFDERLRMVPADGPAYRLAAARTGRALEEERRRGAVTVRSLRRAGTCRLVLRELTAARELFSEAAVLAARLGDVRGEAAALIGLGDAYRYGEDHPEAEPCYRKALRLAHESCPELVDFALQHLAQFRMDTGDPDTAEKLLIEALELRQAKGDPELIAATERALERCESLRG